MDQKSLVKIVKENIASVKEFQKIAGMTSRQVKKYGDEIKVLQLEARCVSEENCPPLVDRTDAPINNKKLKRLKQVVESCALTLSVAPELLSKRRHLEKLIRSEDKQGRYHLPDELSGWRENVIGEPLLSELSGLDS